MLFDVEVHPITMCWVDFYLILMQILGIVVLMPSCAVCAVVM